MALSTAVEGRSARSFLTLYSVPNDTPVGFTSDFVTRP